jgi:phospholipid/cholesterol/gamma-HCH transport system substrate-binding protein
VKGLSSAVKVGIVVLVIAILGYSTWKSVSEHASGTNGIRLYSYFHDASGLAEKSRVMIAGLTIGEIADRSLAQTDHGIRAKVVVRVLRSTKIWSNAVIMKKSSSLLGEYYLEIDPGLEGVPDSKGELPHLLKDGDEIKEAVESTSAGDLMAKAGEIMPHVDQVLLEVRQLAADARSLVNGPIEDMASRLDDSVKLDSDLVHSILQRTDRITADIEKVTGDKNGKINEILDSLNRSGKDLEDLLTTTKGEVTKTGDDVRDKLARIDKSIDALEKTLNNSESISHKIDDDQGTLGKLVNDSTVYDNVAQITEDAKGFTRGLFGLQTIVGLRTEYNFMSGLSRNYFSVELYTRPDKFYLIELVDDGRGRLSEDFVPNAATPTQLVRRETLDDTAFRFSFQYGRKWDWFTARVGIKESTGGAGFDIDFIKDHARLSVDAFDFSFDKYPRLRATLALSFFKYLYFLGGIDDALNSPVTIPILGPNITGGQDPKTFYAGRDFFLGGMLRFTDEDLRTLLFVGGSLISGVTSAR